VQQISGRGTGLGAYAHEADLEADNIDKCGGDADAWP
jgi:hypothetical protein